MLETWRIAFFFSFFFNLIYFFFTSDSCSKAVKLLLFKNFSWSKDKKILCKQGKKNRGGERDKSGCVCGGKREKRHETWNSANLTYNKQNYTLLSFKLWLPSIKVSFRCINWIRHYFPIIICKVQPSILHEIPAAYQRSIYFSGLIYFHDSPIMTAMQAVHQN